MILYFGGLATSFHTHLHVYSVDFFLHILVSFPWADPEKGQGVWTPTPWKMTSCYMFFLDILVWTPFEKQLDLLKINVFRTPHPLEFSGSAHASRILGLDRKQNTLSASTIEGCMRVVTLNTFMKRLNETGLYIEILKGGTWWKIDTIGTIFG